MQILTPACYYYQRIECAVDEERLWHVHSMTVRNACDGTTYQLHLQSHKATNRSSVYIYVYSI